MLTTEQLQAIRKRLTGLYYRHVAEEDIRNLLVENERLRGALSEIKENWIPVSWHHAIDLIDNALKGGKKFGIFFCENCGNTPYENVTYETSPNEICTVCGFNNWIFEPRDGESE